MPTHLRIAALITTSLLAISPVSAQTKGHARHTSAAPATPGMTTVVSGDEGHSVVGWVDIIPFTSKTFHNTRMLRVWLPGNYLSPHNAQRRYPVLYMQDGQNLFDNATAHSGEWNVDESVDHLVGSFKIPPMIVVGIDNAGEKRPYEYLPYPDPHNNSYGPPDKQEVHGKEYATFLITEVMPFIQKKYRVATGVANTGIGGSSYGAIVSLNAMFEYPGVFGKALIESPTLGVGDGQLLKDAEKAKQLPQKMFLAVGTKEVENNPERSAQMVKNAEELQTILRKRGMGPEQLKVVIDEGAVHNEGSWSRRLPDALLFLYGR